MSNWKNLTYDENNNIGWLTINRPDKMNALDIPTLTELRDFLHEAAKKKLTGLVMTGAGEKAFIAGADIAAMTTMGTAEALSFGKLGQLVTVLLETLPYPTIAAVNGFALGGGFEMALSCDFIFATQNAAFGLPEVKLGLIPGFGGTQRLAHKTNSALAKEMIFSGRMMKSDEAQFRGVTLQTFPDKGAMLAQCRSYMDACAKNSPLAIKVAKMALDQGAQTSLEQGLVIEANSFAQLFTSADMKEGTAAFVAKRAPVFKGE